MGQNSFFKNYDYRIHSIKRRGVYQICLLNFVIRVRCLFEGGDYLKSNLFLANNCMGN